MGVCKLSVLGSGSSGNSYILKCNDDALIIEAGVNWDVILKGLNFNTKNVVGMLVTHSHL